MNSINPSLSPNFLSPTSNITSSKSQSPSFNTPNSTRFRPFGSEPIIPFCGKSRLWSLQGSKSVKSRKSFVLEATNMTISEDSLLNGMDEEQGPPDSVLHDHENNSRPRRIALFVEPSPFSYISGYKNRFQNFIKYLREMGDEVMVITTHEGVPKEFHGAILIGSKRLLTSTTSIAS